MQQLTNPQVIQCPFASGEGALKNQIPNGATGTYAASMQEGFPAITMQPTSLGGTPPDGRDMNGILNIATDFYFQAQNGYQPTFVQAVSDAIGGYPQGAILWYKPTGATKILPLISLIGNNTYNFVTTPAYIDGVHWAIAWSSNYLGIEDLGTATVSTTVDLSGPGAAIKTLTLPTNVANVTIILTVPATNLGTYTYELHLITGAQKPAITWGASGGTIKWLTTSLQQQPLELNKTSIFVFRWQNGNIIANFGGAY